MTELNDMIRACVVREEWRSTTEIVRMVKEGGHPEVRTNRIYRVLQSELKYKVIESRIEDTDMPGHRLAYWRRIV